LGRTGAADVAERALTSPKVAVTVMLGGWARGPSGEKTTNLSDGRCVVRAGRVLAKGTLRLIYNMSFL